jgi:acyl-CoA reductase-like NAD-dependent aldehyde dehydrogenase
VGLISSWNHPLLIFLKKLAVALAAGNSVVAKPSEVAPFSPLLFADLATEAGLPAGVLNVVAGDGAIVGGALCEAPEIAKLDLTGGNSTGRIVARIAADRLIPCTLELGGKAPLILFEDTPLEEAVAAALFACFVASGQTCVSGARILVQRSMHEAFLAAFTTRAERIRLGHPMSEDSQMGPVISGRQKEAVLNCIARAAAQGARIMTGGKPAQMPEPLSRGHYIAPTIVDGVTPEMEIWQNELFAPVVCVTAFEDEAEAIELANHHRFGLGASVWTRDIGRAHRVTRRLSSGIVWINDHHKNDPASIWGGFGASGYGKENGWAALRSYMKEQNVVVRLDPDFPDWYREGTRYG